MSWKLDEETLTLTMTKGDTATFKVKHLVKNKETGESFEYVPGENDHYIFAIKKRSRDEAPLVSFEVPKSTMIVKMNESDTKNLPLGHYIWEVSFNTYYGEKGPDGKYVETPEDIHDTILPDKTLILTTEVY